MLSHAFLHQSSESRSMITVYRRIRLCESLQRPSPMVVHMNVVMCRSNSELDLTRREEQNQRTYCEVVTVVVAQ